MPIGKYASLPNLLHIGYEEALRIMGIRPESGPVSLFMNWANEIPADQLQTIHIRDWHDANDPKQQEHLRQFGNHCLKNTPGAEFVYTVKGDDTIIDSTGLNDFIGPELMQVLSEYKDQQVRIGIIGVWTEAKVFFLAYDIATRFPNFTVAVCSALTASSSLHNHYNSLDQLRRILNIHVYDSIGEFTNFLTRSTQGIEIEAPGENSLPEIQFDGEVNLRSTDLNLIRYVFRNSRMVSLRVLDGGFSGNIVLSAVGRDLNGHMEAQHVLKIGNQELIGRERRSFEKIEQVLGNNAPRITEFADSLGRGILKYRYASMGKGESKSFQKLFTSGIPIAKIHQYLETIFTDQLNRFYTASTFERLNFFEYYGFLSASLEQIRKNIGAITHSSPDATELELLTEIRCPNPLEFYRTALPKLNQRSTSYAHMAYVHGDLNGANIIVDAQENVWIIDFFHTHRGHILKDLIKLENDLLYIYTPIHNRNDFEEAIQLSKVLFSTSDLAAPLPPASEVALNSPVFIRTYETIRILRSYYAHLVKMDRNPTQLFIGQIRYAMHTLSFDESSDLQKKWALYNAGHFCEIVRKRLAETGALKISFINDPRGHNNQLGITILPGRKDYSRNLEEDLKEISSAGIDVIVPLLTLDEMERYGVPELLASYEKYHFVVRHFAINDQKIPGTDELNTLLEFLNGQINQGKKILLHCVGGLGRSGLVAACYLKSKGLTSEEAIKAIREIRTSRAIETKEQENFVHHYNYLLNY